MHACTQRIAVRMSDALSPQKVPAKVGTRASSVNSNVDNRDEVSNSQLRADSLSKSPDNKHGASCADSRKTQALSQLREKGVEARSQPPPQASLPNHEGESAAGARNPTGSSSSSLAQPDQEESLNKGNEQEQDLTVAPDNSINRTRGSLSQTDSRTIFSNLPPVDDVNSGVGSSDADPQNSEAMLELIKASKENEVFKVILAKGWEDKRLHSVWKSAEDKGTVLKPPPSTLARCLSISADQIDNLAPHISQIFGDAYKPVVLARPDGYVHLPVPFDKDGQLTSQLLKAEGGKHAKRCTYKECPFHHREPELPFRLEIALRSKAGAKAWQAGSQEAQKIMRMLRESFNPDRITVRNRGLQMVITVFAGTEEVHDKLLSKGLLEELIKDTAYVVSSKISFRKKGKMEGRQCRHCLQLHEGNQCPFLDRIIQVELSEPTTIACLPSDLSQGMKPLGEVLGLGISRKAPYSRFIIIKATSPEAASTISGAMPWIYGNQLISLRTGQDAGHQNCPGCGCPQHLCRGSNPRFQCQLQGKPHWWRAHNGRYKQGYEFYTKDGIHVSHYASTDKLPSPPEPIRRTPRGAKQSKRQSEPRRLAPEREAHPAKPTSHQQTDGFLPVGDHNRKHRKRMQRGKKNQLSRPQSNSSDRPREVMLRHEGPQGQGDDELLQAITASLSTEKEKQNARLDDCEEMQKQACATYRDVPGQGLCFELCCLNTVNGDQPMEPVTAAKEALKLRIQIAEAMETEASRPSKMEATEAAKLLERAAQLKHPRTFQDTESFTYAVKVLRRSLGVFLPGCPAPNMYTYNGEDSADPLEPIYIGHLQNPEHFISLHPIGKPLDEARSIRLSELTVPANLLPRKNAAIKHFESLKFVLAKSSEGCSNEEKSQILQVLLHYTKILEYREAPQEEWPRLLREVKNEEAKFTKAIATLRNLGAMHEEEEADLVLATEE